MNNNWKKIVPAGLAAAAGAAVAVIAKKKPGEASETAAKPVKKAEPKNQAEGVYSFVSGFMDATTVDVKVKYDADRYGFSVVEEGFLVPTSDSHVALLTGADFNAQIEYSPFYAGDDFAKLTNDAKTAQRTFAPVGSGFRYSDSNSVCVCLPVDASSYLLINAMLSKGSKLKFAELPTAPEFVAFIENIEVKA